jgi:hypothetical protein
MYTVEKPAHIPFRYSLTKGFKMNKEGYRLLGPHLKTPNPGLTRGSPPHLLYKRGGEPRVKPGVWRPETWAL